MRSFVVVVVVVVGWLYGDVCLLTNGDRTCCCTAFDNKPVGGAVVVLCGGWVGAGIGRRCPSRMPTSGAFWTRWTVLRSQTTQPSCCGAITGTPLETTTNGQSKPILSTPLESRCVSVLVACVRPSVTPSIRLCVIHSFVCRVSNSRTRAPPHSGLVVGVDRRIQF